MSEKSEWKEWKQQAFKNNLLEDLSQAYYDDESELLYTVSIDGEYRTLPLFSPYSWLIHTHPEAPVASYTNKMYSDYDYDAIVENIAELIPDGEDPEEYVWNDEVFACSEAITDEFWFSFVKSDYFTVRTIQARLENEMYEKAFEEGIDPTAKSEELSDDIYDWSLPYRDEYYPSFSDLATMRKRPRYVGIDATVVLNTGDSYSIVLQEQPGTVTTHPNRLKNTPGGVFNTQDDDSPPYITEFIHKAIESELSIAQDDFETLMDEGQASIETLGVALESIRGYLQLHYLVYVNEPNVGEQLKEEISESGDFTYLDVSDTQAISEYLLDDSTPINSAFGVSESLIRLSRKYNIEFGTEIKRW